MGGQARFMQARFRVAEAHGIPISDREDFLLRMGEIKKDVR